MEHLNRTAKEALGQHSNLNPKSVKRVGNCLGLLRNVCMQFDLATNTHHSSGKHTKSSEDTDLNHIVEQLISSKVLVRCNSRSHASFTTFNGSSLTDRIDADKFFLWMNKHIKKIQVNSMHCKIIFLQNCTQIMKLAHSFHIHKSPYKYHNTNKDDMVL